MSNIILIKRRVSGSTGAPANLSGGELAFNEVDKTLYYGADATNGGTIAIAGNGAFVDLTTSQTISGAKTFTKVTTLSSTTFSSSSLIDAGGNAITNVLNPVNPQEVATKNYVDSLETSAGGQITALSSHVDTYFVEKIESDAVVLNGGLTVSNDLSANAIFTTGNGSIGGNLRVIGNFEVLGDTTVIETTTTTTSSFAITNYGTDTALQVTQVDGTNDVAVFNDSTSTALIIKGDGNVGVGTATPNEKLTIAGNLSASGNFYNNGITSLDKGAITTNGIGTITGTTGVSEIVSFIIDCGSF
jgi:hypothetical protein